MNATMGSTEESLKLLPVISEDTANGLCRFCSSALDSPPNPLFEVATQRVLFACNPCASRFEKRSGGPFKLIPRSTRQIEDFRMPEVPWQTYDLPGNVTFVFYCTAAAKLLSVCKVAAGTVDLTVPREVWKAIIEANPVLEEMRPDVEGLLIIHTGDSREYFIAPIDVCYNLIKTRPSTSHDGLEEAKNIQPQPQPQSLVPQELSYAS